MLCGMLTLLLCAAVLAVPDVPPTDQAVAGLGQQPQPFTMKWSLAGGYAYQLRTHIDDGGRLSWGRGHVQLKGQTPLRDDLELVVGTRWQRDTFTFDGSVGNWGHVDAVQLDAGLQWKVSDRWQVFGGGQVLFSAESGAGFDDAVNGGGAIGAVYAFSESLALGGGVGMRTRTLDDALIYPIVVVEWGITERLRLSTRLTSGWANQTGVELIYDWAEGVQVGVAAVYDYQQFRLSDSNATAPGGVGEATMLPVVAFIAYDVAPNVALTAFVGANVAGHLEARDTTEATVWSTDYEAAPIVGLQGTIRF